MSRYDRSGLAALPDLETSEYRDLFQHLEKIQNKNRQNSRLAETRFARHDVLHQWSRCWEYPYVYHHILKRLATITESSLPTVLDFGCGATFFPFAVADLGATVLCSDIDRASQKEFQIAESAVMTPRGSVRFLLSEENTIPLGDCTVDLICCVSVLEHIPLSSIGKILAELHRILKPGGFLIMTFDLSEPPEYRLSDGDYKEIRTILTERFRFDEPETVEHPANLLHTLNSPYALEVFKGFRLQFFKGKQRLKKLLGKRPMPVMKLFVYGAVFQKGNGSAIPLARENQELPVNVPEISSGCFPLTCKDSGGTVISRPLPLVTFFISAFNQERFIREAVEGAFAQTYSPLEIILSDDCSSDSTFEIMRAMKKEYRGPHSIILNRNDQNLGIGAHVNRIMELAHGTFIVGAAGDDVSLPQRTARIAEFLLGEGQDVVSVFSGGVMMDVSGIELGSLNATFETWMREPARFVRAGLHGVKGASHAWRREVFDRFGPLNSCIVHEDTVIPFRALLLGRIASIPDTLVRCRVHDGSIMRTYAWGTRDGLATWHRRATAHYLNCLSDVAKMESLNVKRRDRTIHAIQRRIRFHTASQCVNRSLWQYFAVQCRWIPAFGKEAAWSAGSAIKMMIRERLARRSAGHLGHPA